MSPMCIYSRYWCHARSTKDVWHHIYKRKVPMCKECAVVYGQELQPEPQPAPAPVAAAPKKGGIIWQEVP